MKNRSTSKMSLSTNFSLIKYEDQILRGDYHNEIGEPLDYFRASDSGSCKLKRYWKRQGKQGDEPSDQSLRSFRSGKMYHDLIEMAFDDIILAKEQPIVIPDKDGKPFIVGHEDMLILPPDTEFKPDGSTLVLYDGKTVKQEKFKYMNATNGRDYHYELQLHTYIYAIRTYGIYIESKMFRERWMNKGYEPEIWSQQTYKNKPYILVKLPGLFDGRLYYMEKNTDKRKELAVPFTEIAEKKVMREIAELHEYWDNQQKPPPKPRESWECGYCPFQTQCPFGQKVLQEKLAKERKTFTL